MFNRIYIEITNVCNLNCDFCPNTNRKKSFMSVNDFECIIDKIKDFTSHIYLHVKGEPLMHPELESMLQIANDNNINVNITTNARLLKEKLYVINNFKIRQINISLHSFNNIEEIKELLNTIDKINNSYISLRLWNNKNNSEVLSLLESHYDKKILFTKNRFILSNNVYLDKDIRFEWPDINRKNITEYGTCMGAKKQLAILVDGTVVPCCLDNDGIINLGNIFCCTINDIMNSDRYKKIVSGFNSNHLEEDLCKKCGYRNRFN